jgi:antibiotic biosynthesis monooxygenase (ABM) superfamily enzyme
MENQSASVVITHHISDGKQEEYEKWLDLIGPVARKSKGNIDWQIIRPIPKLTFNYTVLMRFDTVENLKHWMDSEERKKLIIKASPLLAKEDHYDIKTGIDFLFTPENNKIKVPVRWKQYLVTWSAIYVLSSFIPLLVLPILRRLPLPANRLIDSFFISATIVFLMVYIVMPNYTKLIRKWLYK